MSVILTLKVVLIYSFTEKMLQSSKMLFFSTVADHLVTIVMVK